MRVTTNTQYLTTYQGLNNALSQVQDLQQQMSSGKRINQYSDAPADAANALRLRAQQDDWTAWSRAADDANSRLGVTDSTLQSADTIMQRIKEITVNAANGAIPDASRAALSQEVLQLRDQLSDLANTKYLGNSIFGGFADSAVANVNGTWKYVGDNGQVKRQIGDGVVITANLDGKQIFGFNNPGQDVFSALDQLSSDILTGDNTTLKGDSDLLDARAADITTALGNVGAMVNRVEQTQTTGQGIQQSLQTQRSDLEDVDLTEAVMKLAQYQSGYQAALGAASKAAMPSLADFLK